MQRLVQCVAVVAALAALAVSVWRHESPWTALRRAGIAYLGFYTVGTLLALVYRAGVVAEAAPPRPPRPPSAPGGGGASPPAPPRDGP